MHQRLSKIRRTFESEYQDYGVEGGGDEPEFRYTIVFAFEMYV